jgi:hypothetical protein
VETAFTLRSEVTLYHSTILLKKNLPEQNWKVIWTQSV